MHNLLVRFLFTNINKGRGKCQTSNLSQNYVHLLRTVKYVFILIFTFSDKLIFLNPLFYKIMTNVCQSGNIQCGPSMTS